jgi:hypothetical protein
MQGKRKITSSENREYGVCIHHVRTTTTKTVKGKKGENLDNTRVQWRREIHNNNEKNK